MLGCYMGRGEGRGRGRRKGDGEFEATPISSFRDLTILIPRLFESTAAGTGTAGKS